MSEVLDPSNQQRITALSPPSPPAYQPSPSPGVGRRSAPSGGLQQDQEEQVRLQTIRLWTFRGRQGQGRGGRGGQGGGWGGQGEGWRAKGGGSGGEGGGQGGQ